MTEFCIQLLYTGVDLAEDETLHALAAAGVVAAEPHGDFTRLTAAVEHTNAVQAASSLVAALRVALPSATPVMASRDLVNITDIADRVGVNREAVRHWASGTRRKGEFPTPLDAPGGQKVWEWAAVHAWLRHNLQMWDGLEFPTHGEYGSIDAFIDHANRAPESNVKPAARHWLIVESAVRQHSTLRTVHRSMRAVDPVDWELAAATK